MTRCALRLFVCFQLFYLLWASGRLHTIDEYEAFFMTESLAERGELALPEEKRFFGRRGRDGRFWAPYGPLPALVSLPGYLAGKACGHLFAGTPRARESLLWLFTSATNTTIAAASVALFFLLARRLGATAGAALLAALVFGVATPHWHYATTYFSEPLSTLLLLAAALALCGSVRRQQEDLDLRAVLLAGAPLALLAATRLTTAIVFPVFGVAVLLAAGPSWRRRLAAATAYSALPSVAVLLYLIWNHSRFGDPFQPGYPATVHGGRPSGFDENLFRGFYGLVLSPGKGVLFLATPALLGLARTRAFVRRTGNAAWLAVALVCVPCVPLLFYSTYTYWEGGYCWGPRYLLPTLPFWLLPLAFVDYRSRVWRRTSMSVIGCSVVVQFLGVSVSFLECQVDRGYYGASYRYNLGYSALAETASVFFHYVTVTVRGGFLAEPEGLGFDRWFFFLSKSGLPGPALGFAVAVLVAALAGAVVVLCRTVRQIRAEDTENERIRPEEPCMPITTR